MRPFEFVKTRGPFGDECSLYQIQMRKQMSVQELIDYVLTEERGEWGYIEVAEHRLEYRWGSIVSDELTEADKNMEIKDMFGYGGWSRMDYRINHEKNNP